MTIKVYIIKYLEKLKILNWNYWIYPIAVEMFHNLFMILISNNFQLKLKNIRWIFHPKKPLNKLCYELRATFSSYWAITSKQILSFGQDYIMRTRRLNNKQPVFSQHDTTSHNWGSSVQATTLIGFIQTIKQQQHLTTSCQFLSIPIFWTSCPLGIKLRAIVPIIWSSKLC